MMASPNGIEGFGEFIRSLGFEPPARIEPGRWAPFSTNGKAHDSAGRAKLFPDCEGGIIHDWRSGESWTWQAAREHPRSDSELRAWRERCERAKREAKAEREREAKETAERAARIWKEALPADDSHPYLKSKGVRAHGLRLYRGPLALNGLRLDGALIVAARNVSGALASLSFIDAAGQKRYLAGPKVPGCYFSIGKPDGALCIAEGFATGATIHEATGHAVAIAFDAGNLEPAARALRVKYPQLRLIVCADDDAATAGNPGITKATEAARAVAGFVALPGFGADRAEGATDFNDLARARGAEAVRVALENAKRPAAMEPATQEAAADALDGVQIIRGDTIKPEAIDWLWDGYLASGKVHIMAGAPGTGKTTLAVGIAAALTAGGRWPDGARATAGSVLIWSGEDSPGDTLVPRFIACGADLRRVHFVGDRLTAEGVRAFDPAEDFAALELEAARLTDLRLVIVDPIVSAIAGDSHKNAEVRRGLQPLVRFAERTGCAVLGISHFSKGTAGRDPTERVTGSLAFGALARIVLATAKVPDEDGGGHLLVRAKSNLGPHGGGFKYELRQVELEPPNAGIVAVRPEWTGVVEGDAREILAAAEAQGDPEERSATDECADMLREMLRPGRMETQEARRKLKAEGFTDKQIRRAREALKVRCDRAEFGGKGYWSLSHSCPDSSIDAQSRPSNSRGIDGQQCEPEGINGDGSEVL